jgi:hypothetical protein
MKLLSKIVSSCASASTQATSPPGALNFSHGPQVACRNVGACRQRARQRRHLALPALNFKLKAPPSQWHFKLPRLSVHTATPARANFEGSGMMFGSHDQITIIARSRASRQIQGEPPGRGNRDRLSHTAAAAAEPSRERPSGFCQPPGRQSATVRAQIRRHSRIALRALNVTWYTQGVSISDE